MQPTNVNKLLCKEDTADPIDSLIIQFSEMTLNDRTTQDYQHIFDRIYHTLDCLYSIAKNSGIDIGDSDECEIYNFYMSSNYLYCKLLKKQRFDILPYLIAIVKTFAFVNGIAFGKGTNCPIWGNDLNDLVAEAICPDCYHRRCDRCAAILQEYYGVPYGLESYCYFFGVKDEHKAHATDLLQNVPQWPYPPKV